MNITPIDGKATKSEIEEEKRFLQTWLEMCRTTRTVRDIPAARVVIAGRYEQTFEARLKALKRKKKKAQPNVSAVGNTTPTA